MAIINWSNITDAQQLLNAPNVSTGGLFYLASLFMLFVVMVITMAVRFGIEIAILASSFLCLILSILFVYMGVLAWTWSLFFLGFVLVMFIYIIWSSNRDNV